MLVPVIPSFCREYRATCTKCGATHAFEDAFWLQSFNHKRPTFGPLPPEMEHFREQIIAPPTIQCHQCGNTVLVVPQLRPAAFTAELYGDEAYRELNGRVCFVYSLVGAVEQRMPLVVKRVRDLKEFLEPDRDPASWRFHMKDLHSGSNRKKHPIFSAWDRDRCEHAVEGLFDILRDEPTLLRYSITVWAEALDDAKHRAFQALLIYAMDSLSKGAIRAQFCFDAERAEASASVQAWAQELYREAQSNVLYLFLSRGLTFAEPKSVKPGEHPCSELADFLAFVVARHHYDTSTGSRDAPAFYPLEKAGMVMWARFDDHGNLVVTPNIGYPDDAAQDA